MHRQPKTSNNVCNSIALSCHSGSTRSRPRSHKIDDSVFICDMSGGSLHDDWRSAYEEATTFILGIAEWPNVDRNIQICYSAHELSPQRLSMTQSPSPTEMHELKTGILCKSVFPVDPNIFQLCKILEMKWSMLIAVERKWCINLDMNRLLFNSSKWATHEAVVPRIVLWYQEVSTNLVTQQ